MFGLYLFSLIFGFLIIIIDLFSLFGGPDDGSGADADGHGGVDSHGDGFDHGDGDGSDGADLDGDDQALVMPDTNKGRFVYRALNLLRIFVYFCAGFGAVGVFGTLTKNPTVKTLLYSIVTGIALVIIVKTVSRLQSKVTDSQLKSGELLFAEAEVLVSIAAGKLGKVRVKTGGSYHDLFARAESSDKSYPKGKRVYVVDLTGSEIIVSDTK